MSKDYLPHGDVPFYEWVKNFVIYLLMYLVKWGLPAGCADKLNELLGKYKLALETAHDARHTTQDIEKKNEAKEELMTEVRQFVGMHIAYNKNITNDERKVCGLPIYDNTWTPTKIPDTFPLLDEFLHPAPARIVLKMRDSKTKKAAKPDEVHGTEIRFTVREVQVYDVEDMEQSGFVTRMKALFQFTGKQVRMYFSFCMRYENSRGEKGPWSPVYHIVIS
jgi:hypothetical protein